MGRSWGARVVVGQVRFLARARRESAQVGAWIGRHGRGVHGRGSAWVVPSMVVGGVRLLTEGRRESARVVARRGSTRHGHGVARLGGAWKGMEGSSDGRRQGSTPCPSTARKGIWRGETPRVQLGYRWARLIVAGHGKAVLGPARHGERYWQTPGFKSPERTARKGYWKGLEELGRPWSGRASSGPARQGKEHNGGPGVLSPRPPQARQLTHPGGYQ